MFFMFNLTESASSQEQADEEADVPTKHHSAAALQDAFRAFVDGRKVRCGDLKTDMVLDAHRSRSLRRYDGVAPPRCVVHHFMRSLGNGKRANELWPPRSADVFREELAAYTNWFRSPMASCIARRPVRLKRGKRWKMKPKRADGSTMPIQRTSVLSADWDRTVSNQVKPMVVNALMASADLKELMVRVYGPNALSLGIVATEQTWWHDHLQNMNSPESGPQMPRGSTGR